MKILTKITILASLLAIGLGTTLATTTDTLQISVDGVTVQIQDNGSCVNIAGTGCSSISGDTNAAAGTDSINGTLGGWTLSIVSGTSNSPGDDPFGLDLTSLTATCKGGGTCATNSLDVQYSDINFSPANPSFLTQYSDTQNGTGTTSESAWFSNKNKLFAETTAIGTVGPFSGTSHGSATGGVGSVAPYSLTLDQTFTDAGSSVAFSVDGSVSSVPEPGAIVLLGTVLVFCASKLRRRRAL
jgi:hypothetical protein